jgi:hypothetical protein
MKFWFWIFATLLALASIGIGVFIQVPIKSEEEKQLHESIVRLTAALEQPISINELRSLYLDVVTKERLADAKLTKKKKDEVNEAIRKVLSTIDIWRTKIECNGYFEVCIYKVAEALKELSFIQSNDRVDKISKEFDEEHTKDIVSRCLTISMVSLAVAETTLSDK